MCKPNIVSTLTTCSISMLKRQRDHPFKTSAFFRGGRVSQSLRFADSRGVGVSGMPRMVGNFAGKCRWLPTGVGEAKIQQTKIVVTKI